MSGTPTNRAGRIANYTGEKAQDHSEFSDEDRMIILYKGHDDEAVVVMFGYRESEHEVEGLTDLVVGLVAVFEAHGLKLSLIPMGAKGMG